MKKSTNLWEMFNIFQHFSREGTIFTGRNEVLAKVIFLHLSVILFTGGGLARRPPSGWMENPPSPPAGWGTPPGWMENPPRLDGEPPRLEGEPPRLDGEPPPPGWKETPPWLEGEPPPPPPPRGSRLRHTVYDRPVRILLECILVYLVFEKISVGCAKWLID